jgi:Ca2+-binding EF-hand superfamily protein
MKLKSTLLFGALLATTSFSQDGDRPRPPGGPGGPEGRNPADMLKRSDTDGDGKVSKDEFIKARAAEMEEAFARIDGNSDGFVDEAEVSQIAERMRRPEGDSGFRRPPEGGDRPEGGPRPEGAAAFMEQAFGRMDQDGSGQLSREEFTQGMAKMREMMGRGGMGRGEGPGGAPGAGRPPGGGGEGGFRRPPQQGGEGSGKPRPPLEGEGDKPAPAPEKKGDA